MQIEVDMYHFYRLAAQRVPDGTAKEVLENLLEQEQDHLQELQQKYHLALPDNVLLPPPGLEAVLAQQLMPGMEIENGDTARSIYEKALELERRSAAFFEKRASELPDGPERRICQELAAEEREHVALLETELQHLG